jgi:hypothetical protein
MLPPARAAVAMAGPITHQADADAPKHGKLIAAGSGPNSVNTRRPPTVSTAKFSHCSFGSSEGPLAQRQKTSEEQGPNLQREGAPILRTPCSRRRSGVFVLQAIRPCRRSATGPRAWGRGRTAEGPSGSRGTRGSRTTRGRSRRRSRPASPSAVPGSSPSPG